MILLDLFGFGRIRQDSIQPGFGLLGSGPPSPGGDDPDTRIFSSPSPAGDGPGRRTFSSPSPGGMTRAGELSVLRPGGVVWTEEPSVLNHRVWENFGQELRVLISEGK